MNTMKLNDLETKSIVDIRELLKDYLSKESMEDLLSYIKGARD